ncbi:hypothetical protein K501DRAFT_277923 [Backusella circina FSU 941]|nr:hypothetical protein K501DRAFT_277923 [Backusella circina FSU 941]
MTFSYCPIFIPYIYFGNWYFNVGSFPFRVIVNPTIEKPLNDEYRLKVEAFGLPGMGIAPPAPSFADQLKPLFPPFGSLVAPRVPNENGKDSTGHGPLSDYTIKYLQSLTLDEARQLKDKLVKQQWSKNESFENNVRFMYLLDEALYDVGIVLDFSVRDIMFKIDHIAQFDLKALSPSDLFTVKISAGEASKQLLRRYLTLSQLNFIKRYVDSAIKDVLEVDKKAN